MFSKRMTLAGSEFRARLQRLSDRGHRPNADEHELTLMFTDIAGFTRLAEALPAAAVALAEQAIAECPRAALSRRD